MNEWKLSHLWLSECAECDLDTVQAGDDVWGDPVMVSWPLIGQFGSISASNWLRGWCQGWPGDIVTNMGAERISLIELFRGRWKYSDQVVTINDVSHSSNSPLEIEMELCIFSTDRNNLCISSLPLSWRWCNEHLRVAANMSTSLTSLSLSWITSSSGHVTRVKTARKK